MRLSVSDATSEVLLGVAYDSLFGLARACAMNSGIDFTGRSLFTTSANGNSPTRAIGVKSAIGSYGSFWNRLGLAECEVLVVMNSV